MPAASITLRASATTSGPMPSPPMIPIRWVTPLASSLLGFASGCSNKKPPTEVDGRERTPVGVRLRNDDHRVAAHDRRRLAPARPGRSAKSPVAGSDPPLRPGLLVDRPEPDLLA